MYKCNKVSDSTVQYKSIDMYNYVCILIGCCQETCQLGWLHYNRSCHDKKGRKCFPAWRSVIIILLSQRTRLQKILYWTNQVYYSHASSNSNNSICYFSIHSKYRYANIIICAVASMVLCIRSRFRCLHAYITTFITVTVWLVILCRLKSSQFVPMCKLKFPSNLAHQEMNTTA